MDDFSQLFNNESISKHYNYRPEYSPNIIREMINFWYTQNKDSEISKSFNIVDVGCGTGQLTRALAPYANAIIGIDTSKSQIDEARRSSNANQYLKFEVGSCYNIPVANETVDILTAAQCVHWFDLDKFYAEADRCLKSKGVLVISMYEKGYFVINNIEDKNSELNKFLTNEFWFDEKYLGKSLNDSLKWADKQLKGMPFLYPSTGLRNHNLFIEMRITLNRYCQYIRSTSRYQKWEEKHKAGKDIIKEAMEKVLFYLGDPESGLDTEVLIKYPLTLLMCSKP